MVKCPYCDAVMKHRKRTDQYVCPGGGRLLTKESGECQFKGDKLTLNQIQQIVVALIDVDMDD